MFDPFVLGSIAKALVLPPGGPLLVALAGVLLLPVWPRAGRLLAGAGVLVLLALSLPFAAVSLTRVVNDPAAFDPGQPTGAEAIVILGGGTRHGAAEYGGDTLGRLTLERVRYGARLARQTGLPVLVTGGSLGGREPVATLMRESLDQVFDPGRGFCVTAGYLQGAPNWWDSLSTWCFKHKLTADTTPPQVPGGGSGSFIPSSLGDLPVSWSRSPSDTGVPATTDVVRYEVMRSQDGGSTWIDAQVVTATGAAGYSYTYRSVLLSKVRVRAVDSSNNASGWVVLF